MLSEHLQDGIKAFSKKVNPFYHTKLKIAKKGYKTHSREYLLIKKRKRNSVKVLFLLSTTIHRLH